MQFIPRASRSLSRCVVRKTTPGQVRFQLAPEFARIGRAEFARLSHRRAISRVVFVVTLAQHLGDHVVRHAFLSQFHAKGALAARAKVASIFQPVARKGPVVQQARLAQSLDDLVNHVWPDVFAFQMAADFVHAARAIIQITQRGFVCLVRFVAVLQRGDFVIRKFLPASQLDGFNRGQAKGKAPVKVNVDALLVLFLNRVR